MFPRNRTIRIFVLQYYCIALLGAPIPIAIGETMGESAEDRQAFPVPAERVVAHSSIAGAVVVATRWRNALIGHISKTFGHRERQLWMRFVLDWMFPGGVSRVARHNKSGFVREKMDPRRAHVAMRASRK